MATYTTNKDGSITKTMASGAKYTVSKDDDRYKRVANESVSNTPKASSAPAATTTPKVTTTPKATTSGGSSSGGGSSNKKTTTTSFTEGGITYENKNGKIYKNGVLVPESNYKFIPTQVGGSRQDPAPKAGTNAGNNVVIKSTATNPQMTKFTEGGITYENKNGQIYKNGTLVPESNYKFIPVEVGGTRLIPAGQAGTAQPGQAPTAEQANPYGDQVLGELANQGMPTFNAPNIPFQNGQTFDLGALYSGIPETINPTQIDLSNLYKAIPQTITPESVDLSRLLADIQKPNDPIRMDFSGLMQAIQKPGEVGRTDFSGLQNEIMGMKPTGQLPVLPDYGAMEKQMVDWVQPSYGPWITPEQRIGQGGESEENTPPHPNMPPDANDPRVMQMADPNNFTFQNMLAGQGGGWTPTLAGQQVLEQQNQNYLDQLSRVAQMEQAENQWATGVGDQRLQDYIGNMAALTGMQQAEGQWAQQFGQSQNQDYLNQLANALQMGMQQNQWGNEFQANQLQNQFANLANVTGIDMAQRQWGDQFSADQLQNQFANLSNVAGMDMAQSQWAQGLGMDKQNQLYQQWAQGSGLNLDGYNSYADVLGNLASNILASQQFAEQQKQNNIGNAMNLSEIIGRIVQPKSSGQSLFNQANGGNTLAMQQFLEAINQFNQTFQEDRRQFDSNLGEDRRQFEARLASDNYWNNISSEYDYAKLALDAAQGAQQAGQSTTPTPQQYVNYYGIYSDIMSGKDPDTGKAISSPQDYFNSHKQALLGKLGPKLFNEMGDKIIMDDDSYGYGNPSGGTSSGFQSNSKGGGSGTGKLSSSVKGPTEYVALAESAASKYGVPANLVKAVIQQESGWKPSVKSSAGAVGLMQLMPGTAAGLGVKDSTNPAQNIDGGVRYLAQQLKKYNGNVKLALAAYNAGPGNVDKYGGVPPFKETQKYVKNVMAMAGLS